MTDASAQLRAERDLLLRLLELGARDDLAPFLKDALSLVVEVTGAERGYLALEGSTRSSRFFRARGFDETELDEVRRAISTGIIQKALSTGATVSTASAIDDPRFRDQRSVRAQRIQAVLCAPVGGQRPCGVIYLQGKAGPGPFSEEHRRLCELFALHLSPLADRLLSREERPVEQDHTAEPRQRLKAEAIAGRSRALGEVLRQLVVASQVELPVLLTGESGTGKTALARALHDSSPRAQGPFVEINCAALPEALLESELFGAEKGAHSTATRRVDGKVEAARGGTLFLDEIGEMPVASQGKLLSFLQSKRYYRLGGSQPISADVRVVAATNADLEQAIAERRFREDLFYRLNVLSVRVAPLRERAEDIAPLSEAIARRVGEQGGRPLPLSGAARVALGEATWPGNVRQLENAIARGWAVAVSEGAPAIEPRHVFPGRPAGEAGGEAGEPRTYEDALRAFQARFLKEALEASGWNVSETARTIGLSRSHLNDLIRAHGLSRAQGGKGTGGR